MANLVVKIEKSGNRYNAWDIDGNKFTSKLYISGVKLYTKRNEVYLVNCPKAG